jgi:site-specific DNA-methyltransferase (adenine-specific)
MSMINKIINADCLEEMPKMAKGSVDMILTDLPYEKTKLEWDTPIDLTSMWNCFNHVLKENGVVVMTTQQPFTTKVIKSNLEMYKQQLIWLKTRPSNVFNAKKMFMNWHEEILIFYKKLPTFNPQMEQGKPYKKTHYLQQREKGVYNKTGEKDGHISESNGTRYPKTVLEISNPNKNSLHPTQKPVPLFEYLIKTYSNEGDTVLDCCAGSGTTGVACKKTNRGYTLIEKEKIYYDMIIKRIEEEIS